MGTDLAIRQSEISDLCQLGGILAKSGMFQDARQEAQAVVKVLAGREMGFGAIASMTGVNVIKGRVSLSANLMAAAVKRSGKYTYRVRTMDDSLCEIEFFERMDGKWESIGISPFSAEDAARAQTQNMNKFPRNMLFARALSNGVRWFCPDVTGGPVYTPEELGAEVDDEGEMLSLPQVEVERADDGLQGLVHRYNTLARRAVDVGVPDVAGLKHSDDSQAITNKGIALVAKIKSFARELHVTLDESPVIWIPEEDDHPKVWLAAIEEMQEIIKAGSEIEQELEEVQS